MIIIEMDAVPSPCSLIFDGNDARDNRSNLNTSTPTYELKSECSDENEYEPTFLYLRLTQHPYVFDNIAC